MRGFIESHAPNWIWWTYLWIANARNTRSKRTYRQHMAHQAEIHRLMWGGKR